MLRKVRDRQDFAGDSEKASALVEQTEQIEQIGAEPYHARDPLPPIVEDDVHLITWMALVVERP